MNRFLTPSRPGYMFALLALALGLGFVVTGSAEGMLAVAVLEAMFWAGTQYFKDRRGRRLKPLS